MIFLCTSAMYETADPRGTEINAPEEIHLKLRFPQSPCVGLSEQAWHALSQQPE